MSVERDHFARITARTRDGATTRRHHGDRTNVDLAAHDGCWFAPARQRGV
jgi:hypothetical protein